ncbi:hypothetical protein Vadar_004454 [Vaccinium darrowii]|uniref:Uncharacterized protein n=1 Tax=Vaccinium darrowii TaxID=229202 RepID=A0ACB7YBF9_9ERIC|nr:hypothetical protein Vadar_004454 [Vaccinium darrowii]
MWSTTIQIAWHEALEILQLGPFCHKIGSNAIKAIAIYSPNLRKFRLSGIRDIDGDAINALAKHCLSLIKIGFVDCHNIDEVAVSNVVLLQFLSVAGTTRMNRGLVSKNWTKLPNLPTSYACESEGERTEKTETPFGEKKRLSHQTAKQFNPSSVDNLWYAWWEKSGYFVADSSSSKLPFVINVWIQCLVDAWGGPCWNSYPDGD